MVESLGAADRLLLATANEALAGWLLLSANPSPLTRHWARVLRVQTALGYRGRGVGRALMGEVARSACEDLGLEQLHLELRAGLGLEEFYACLGWHEVGRWPGALRLAEHDRRDEILMLLRLCPSRRLADVRSSSGHSAIGNRQSADFWGACATHCLMIRLGGRW